MVLVRPSRSGLATLMIVAASGCEVHGLIGSNASAGGDGGDGGVESSGGNVDDDGSATTPQSTDESADGSDDDTPGDGTSGARFDLGQPDAPGGCDLPSEWPTCDGEDDDPFHAMGINCEGGPQANVSHANWAEEPLQAALTVHHGKLGTYTGPPPGNGYAPREGGKFAVLSTGEARELGLSMAQLRAKYGDVDGHPCQNESNLGCPSTVLMDMDGIAPDDGPMPSLPAPINMRNAHGDCEQNVDFVGTGDCSMSLEEEWKKGGWQNGYKAYDYAEMRMMTTVPPGIDGFKFDFAFFSVEYPLYDDHQSIFNDMFFAWLDSESWTGNVSFDNAGNVISTNSVLFNYKGDPQLQGFAAEGHGGTEWLTTTAPVHPGEAMTLVFSLFDMGDATFDSMVILDHFEWTCSGVPPFTTPAG